MKTISVQFEAELAKTTTTFCTLFYVERTDGFIFAATDHDSDIIYEDVRYLANSGYSASDVESGSDLNADNLDIEGFLVSPSITEQDLRAGLWDYASYRIFSVNYEDLTMGAMSERAGRLGEVTLRRNQFVAELRGLTDAYRKTLGRMESPSCNARFGDARCMKDLGPLTVTGIIDSMNADGLTLYAADRTEAGPTGGIAITNVSNANPGVVTLASPFAPELIEGELVTIAGVVGPSSINVVTTVFNPSGSTFQLNVDTSDTTDYPPYVSGGMVTRLGADTGFFDFGVITMTSGANANIAREVKSYTTGQISLQLPFPYAIESGDTYSMVPGCDKSFATCRDRWGNAVNHRGMPFLPGMDKITQVGRRSS